METLSSLLIAIIQHLPGLIMLGLLIFIAAIYIQDRRQTEHTIRSNYPIVGRFRYILEEIGVFLRQYFFAQDRDEMPFNRAIRSWVYRAAKQESTLQPFGSTRDQKEGDVVFANAVIPWTEPSEPEAVVFGPYCPNPFSTTKVFNISGMSFGAISKPAIQALALGAKKAGIWINTGEGGASEFHLNSGADVVFQIGTAKYGVRDSEGSLSEEKLKQMAARENVRMFEIKISQGAKPGKGGILPADKVTPEIAAQRGIKPYQASISPPRHVEIGNADELFQFIHRIRTLTEKPTGFKICIGNIDDFEAVMTRLLSMADEAAAGIEDQDQKSAAREQFIRDYAPDFITIDAGNGGTGAAPMSLIDACGLNIRESLPLVVNLLERLGLRKRIRLVASGKMITPIEVAWALCAGADTVNSARGFMFSLGCIQALQCHQNTCPTGITTHNPKLQRGLNPTDKSERVAAYANEMHKELETIAHSCGVASAHHLSRRNAMIYIGNERAVSMEELYRGNLSHENRDNFI